MPDSLFEAAAPDAQPVLAPLTNAAIFLVLTVRPGDEHAATVREVCGDLAAMVRSVGSRVPEGTLSCVLGIGSDVWDRVVGGQRPLHLHTFAEIRADGRHAPATPGDLLFHIRAGRMDLCFELAGLVCSRLGDAVRTVDETQTFSLFDQRDVIGFVDGTENPSGAVAVGAVLVGEEDPTFAQGSYVVVQKYLHDMTAWNAVPVEEQERIVGRTKLSNVELPDDVKPAYAHNALTAIEQDGVEVRILRDNMPFGSPGRAEFGTYFVGYARDPAVVELMLRNMFVGNPAGTYDRLLDFSTAVTGGLFFVPPQSFVDSLADR